MQVYGQNFTLPERTVNFDNLQYRAYNIPIPTTLEMGQDHSITVCLNPDITNGSFFESNRRPTRLGPNDGEQPSITVKLLAPDYQTTVETTVIYGTRVTKVGGLELSNTAGGISTFTVDFKSVYWEQIGGDQYGSSIGTNNWDSSRNTTLGNGNEDGDDSRATNDPMQAPNLE